MSIGLLLITHEGIAQGLLTTAVNMLGDYPLPTRALEVPLDADPSLIQQQGQAYIQQLNQGDGVLILSDIYGGTPCNIGQKLLTSPLIRMVTGVNLPMLVRILNYPQLNLEDMIQKAISGGQDGILLRDCSE